jgi:hypothetical protein
MAKQRIPNDPYQTGLSDDDYDRAARLDTEVQADPELVEGPASRGRIALYAVGIIVILGAVFYGLNHTGTRQASTAPPAQTAQTQPASPQAPPVMRDVTPHANSQPGVTTGAATSRSTPPQPQSSSTGSDLDRAANPQAGQNNDNR